METLNVTLANDNNASESLDVELSPVTKKSFARYRSLLRIMDTIHNDIADKLNEKREATKAGFFRPEDDYIPESKKNNFFSLMMDIRNQTKPAAILP